MLPSSIHISSDFVLTLQVLVPILICLTHWMVVFSMAMVVHQVKLFTYIFIFTLHGYTVTIALCVLISNEMDILQSNNWTSICICILAIR